jgi:hypothetical protein
LDADEVEAWRADRLRRRRGHLQGRARPGRRDILKQYHEKSYAMVEVDDEGRAATIIS